MFVLLTSWGLNLSSSLSGPNLATQANLRGERGDGIRSSLLLGENIFFLVSSHRRHFSGGCVRCPFIICSSKRLKHIWCGRVWVFVSAGAKRQRRCRCTFCIFFPGPPCVSEPSCGRSVDGSLLSYICLLAFTACSIFRITWSGTRPSAGAVRFPSNSLIPQWLFRVYPAVLSVLLSVPDQKTGPL